MTLRNLSLAFITVLSSGAFAQTTNWTDLIKMSGDFRFRHDYDSRTSFSDTNARNRERLRLRVGVDGKVNDDITIKTRFAGSDGQDPLGTNNTMDNNGQPKQFYIDRAYAKWKLCPDATLNIGKQENPLQILGESQMLFDVDYNPEGFSLQTKMESIPVFLTLAAFSLQERHKTNEHENSWLNSAMLGYKYEAGEGMGATFALGYHYFSGLKGEPVLTGGALGNTVQTATTNYANDYQVGEVIAEYHGKVSGVGYKVYADAIQNFAIAKNNNGLLAGVALNTFNDAGKAAWTVGYAYETNATDATVSALNNSDLGDGQDGLIGHMVSLAHPIAANAMFSVLYMHALVNNAGNPYWTDRGFGDLVFNF